MYTHFNKQNFENKLRISLDFRIMLYDDYINYLNTDLKKPIKETYREKENLP